MEKLNIQLVWTESIVPLITELDGKKIPAPVKKSLECFPPYYNTITLRGYMRGSSFAVEELDIEGVPSTESGLNSLLYDAGYPDFILNVM